MSNFERVKKFMETFGQEIKEKAEFPNKKITDLRYDLIKEDPKALEAYQKGNRQSHKMIFAIPDNLQHVINIGCGPFCNRLGPLDSTKTS